ncbi:S-layer homology domain-containing protein [Arthrobacter cavernae]|uniref:S-layer homology domain-containing protein n=1 Tax=Arthrobacter cavernae TaxID=2817681 RepID=UPI0027DD32FC|nr:S-layer homology domain-containing protein [Arthrobacter cavernae]
MNAIVASALDPADRPRPFQTDFVQAPFLAPYDTGIDPVDGAPVNYYSVTEMVSTANILPRLTTPILGYNGIFPGPTISLDQGTKAVLRVRNQMPLLHPSEGYLLASSVHLHGSASLPQFDGYANDVTNPGFAKDYRYPNFQPARTLWYHDHAVHFTAQNVYSGLAAQYHMHDPVERALLPQGQFDVALTISDASFAQSGALGYDANDHSGLWGDVILVNGKPWPVMKVQKRVYRFRILNACISRSLRPTLSNGDPVTVVATDGGLVPVAQTVASWRHAGAERYEVLIDFRKYSTGQRVELRNLSNENNVNFADTGKIMAFDVVDDAVDTTDPTWNTIPTQLAASESMSIREDAATNVRNFRVNRNDLTGVWTIGDNSWEEVVASGFKKAIANPALDAVEIWQFENNSGGWFHPIHLHLVDFRILDRNGRPPFPYERGPKDVVYVGEGETVRLLMKFGPHRGRYMIHCHNLPHEDHSMMVQFRVGMAEDAVDVNDPVKAAPAQWDGIAPAPPVPVFHDVQFGSQFVAEINWLAAAGITTGFPDGTFHPNEPVHRNAMAAFLYRFSGKPSFTNTVFFSDNRPGGLFYREISWLAARGITTGFPDGTFRPFESINRDAMAAFLYRLAGKPPVTKPSEFPDVRPGHQFFTEVSWLASTGITTGFPDGTFKPQDKVSRAAMAAFLFRFNNL